MRVLVCVKRVPDVGGSIALTPDGAEIDTHFLGFTISPHEECALEAAVRLVESSGGSSVVLSLGPSEAEDQLRYALSFGIDQAVLIEAPASEVGPRLTAREIASAALAIGDGEPFDLLLFGNEAPDSGDFQVGIRVAEALDLPCVTGVKDLVVEGRTLVAKRDNDRGVEVYRVELPAVVTVKEGLNLPRYPSLPGRLRAKSKPIEHREVAEGGEDGLRTTGVRLPGGEGRRTEDLGTGADAARRVVDLFCELGVLAR